MNIQRLRNLFIVKRDEWRTDPTSVGFVNDFSVVKVRHPVSTSTRRSSGFPQHHIYCVKKEVVVFRMVGGMKASSFSARLSFGTDTLTFIISPSPPRNDAYNSLSVEWRLRHSHAVSPSPLRRPQSERHALASCSRRA